MDESRIRRRSTVVAEGVIERLDERRIYNER